MKTPVTKENNDYFMEFFSVTIMKADKKTRIRVHRNGRTKYWKTRPNDFRIPIKYGLYEYGYIDQDNCHLWTID